MLKVYLWIFSILGHEIGLYFWCGLALQSCVLVLVSKEAEEEEAEKAEQNLEIAFKLLIDTQGWGWVVWKAVQGVTLSGGSQWGGGPGA